MFCALMYQNLTSNFFVSAPISQHLSPSGDREGKIKVNKIRCLSLFSNITVFLKKHQHLDHPLRLMTVRNGKIGLRGEKNSVWGLGKSAECVNKTQVGLK